MSGHADLHSSLSDISFFPLSEQLLPNPVMANGPITEKIGANKPLNKIHVRILIVKINLI